MHNLSPLLSPHRHASSTEDAGLDAKYKAVIKENLQRSESSTIMIHLWAQTKQPHWPSRSVIVLELEQLCGAGHRLTPPSSPTNTHASSSTPLFSMTGLKGIHQDGGGKYVLLQDYKTFSHRLKKFQNLFQKKRLFSAILDSLFSRGEAFNLVMMGLEVEVI